MDETTAEKVRAIIADQVGVDIEDVVDTATLDDLGADSLDMVELVMALEEGFGIQISDDAAGNFDKVSDIVKYIEVRLGA